MAIEDPEPGADQKKQRELHQNHRAAEEQSSAGIALVARHEQPLDHELVSAVRGGVQEHAADQSGPECVSG